jgi:hypothetical protein
MEVKDRWYFFTTVKSSWSLWRGQVKKREMTQSFKMSIIIAYSIWEAERFGIPAMLKIEAHFAHLPSNFPSSKWTHGSHLVVEMM